MGLPIIPIITTIGQAIGKIADNAFVGGAVGKLIDSKESPKWVLTSKQWYKIIVQFILTNGLWFTLGWIKYKYPAFFEAIMSIDPSDFE